MKVAICTSLISCALCILIIIKKVDISVAIYVNYRTLVFGDVYYSCTNLYLANTQSNKKVSSSIIL